jgi:hypothetical protein
VDWSEDTKRVITAGLYKPKWNVDPEVIYPSVGYFESEYFDPSNWKTNYPYIPFEYMTPQDAYWGARIVTSFTDEQIAACVREGRYSNPDAEEYVINTLKQRRDKIGRYWFSRVNPLDDFVLENSGNCCTLEFDDLAISRKISEGSDTAYRYRFIKRDKPRTGYLQTTQRKIILPDSPADISLNQDKDLFSVSIDMRRNKQDPWSKPVYVIIGYDKDRKYRILGIRRDS